MPKNKQEWEDLWDKSNTYIVAEKEDNLESDEEGEVPDIEDFEGQDNILKGKGKGEEDTPIEQSEDDYNRAFKLLKEYSGYKKGFLKENIGSWKKSYAKLVREVLEELEKNTNEKDVATIYIELAKKIGSLEGAKKGDFSRVLEVIDEKNRSGFKYENFAKQTPSQNYSK